MTERDKTQAGPFVCYRGLATVSITNSPQNESETLISKKQTETKGVAHVIFRSKIPPTEMETPVRQYSLGR